MNPGERALRSAGSETPVTDILNEMKAALGRDDTRGMSAPTTLVSDGGVKETGAIDVMDETGGTDVIDDISEEEEEEEEDLMDDTEPGDSNGMETLNSLDGSNSSQYNAETFHTPSFGDESFEIPTYAPAARISPNSAPSIHDQVNYGHAHPHQQQQQQFQQGQQQQQQQHSAPIFPPANFDIPDISYSNSVTGGPSHYPTSAQTGGGMAAGPGTTMEIRRESGSDSDDGVPLAQLANRQPAAYTSVAPAKQTAAPKKARSPKKGKKKKDPNEPQKPVSAYALFFRDTQAAIKGQNPNATFGEVSKIVASMWDNLGVDSKNVYKKKTELAKKEYLKQLAVYRASLVSKQTPYDYPGGDSSGMMSGSPPEINKQLAQLQEMAQVASQLSSPSRLSSPPSLSPHTQAHLSPPQHMHSPQHMGSQHMSPSQHMGSQHMSPSQHMGSQHMSQSQHMGSPQHMSPQQRPSPPHGGSPHSLNHPMHQSPQMEHNGYLSSSSYTCPQSSDQEQSYCIRKGCVNPAVNAPNYENTYCSNECVVSHCRDVFQSWVANRQTSYGSVK